MAFKFSETEGTASAISSSSAQSTIMEPSHIASGLPDGYVTHFFTSLSKLKIAAQRVLEGLNQNDDAGNQPTGWPSLVIVASVSESLTRLREDARWWFENSEGAVRTVVLLSIERTQRTVRLQKWQWSPPGQSVTPQQALRIQQMTIPSMPPLGLQLAGNQRPFIAQTATITPTNATGSLPIHLHYQAPFSLRPKILCLWTAGQDHPSVHQSQST